MATLTVLTVPFDTFQPQIDSLLATGDGLLAEKPFSDQEYHAFKEKAADWSNQLQGLLDSSFSSREYSMEFRNAGRGFYVPGPQRQKPVHELIKEEQQQLRKKVMNLRYYFKIWETCDLICGRTIDLSLRKQFSVTKRLNFLLEKLYHLDDGAYFPMSLLFEGNGIPVRDANQMVDIGNELSGRGWVSVFGGAGPEVNVQITTAGSLYVEQNLLRYTEDYTQVPSDLAAVVEAINAIKEAVNVHSAGQQVLFEELEEMKELFTKMSKKSWGQLLKGKLVDIALDKIISIEAANFIWHSFTNHDVLRLLP